MYFEWIMLVLVDEVISVQEERKGPPEKTKDVERVIAKAGEDVRIACPVRGSPHPIVEWSKVENCHDYLIIISMAYSGWPID